MKILTAVLLLGYLVETAFMFLVVAASFIWGFYDSFYNQFLIERLMGHKIPGGGFSLSIVIALILGSIAQTNKGWNIISRCLKKIPLMKHLVNIVDQWKRFSKHAHRHGVILAPYFRKDSTFWPGIVTNLIPKETGGFLVTVTFGKITGPEPSMLTEEEIIFMSLTPSEAFAYMFSGGLALKIFDRTVKPVTLGEYIRSSPELLQEIMSGK